MSTVRGINDRILRALLILAFVTGTGFVSYVAALVIVQSPEFVWRLLRHGESDTGDWQIFVSRPIEKSPAPSALAEAATAVDWDDVLGEPLERFMHTTGTHALIVLQNGRIVLEAYGNGRTRESIVTSFSVAKSFNAALIGAAIAEGLIGSVDDPVVVYVPELAGRGFDEFTIRDLLMMSTGIRYVHDDDQPFYLRPFGDDAYTYYAPNLREAALSVRQGSAPVGEEFYYNNYHPLIEGLILERVAGTPVAHYLESRIWQPMGAAFDASWSLDSAESGFEKMESGINARAIDFARFGLLFLNEGEVEGTRVLPAEWAREATAPLDPDPRPWGIWPSLKEEGVFYKYHWWGLHLPEGGFDFYAHGKFDQVIYVALRRNAVVVRFGDKPNAGLRWPFLIRDLITHLPPA